MAPITTPSATDTMLTDGSWIVGPAVITSMSASGSKSGSSICPARIYPHTLAPGRNSAGRDLPSPIPSLKDCRPQRAAGRRPVAPRELLGTEQWMPPKVWTPTRKHLMTS